MHSEIEARFAGASGTPAVEIPALGMRVHPMTAAEAAATIGRWAAVGDKRVLASHNLHSAFLLTDCEPFAEFYARLTSITVIDGTPILMLARRARPGLSHRHRIGSLDWIAGLREHAPDIGRIAVVGAVEESNAQAVARLRREVGVEILGLPGEGWNAARAEQVVAELNAWKPDLVLVGLGMPTQETFLLDAWDRLPPAAYATVGGAIDQIAGVQRPAPRWLGRFGVEWAWRLATNPRRLAGRYLVEPLVLGRRIISSGNRKR